GGAGAPAVPPGALGGPLKESAPPPDPGGVIPSTPRSLYPSRPRVAVCVPVEDGDAAVLPRLVGELERAHLVELEIVLADLTLAGELARHGFAGTRVVRGTPGSRGSAYRAALAASDAPL